MIKTCLFLALTLGSTMMTRASFLPFFDNLRATVLDRQVAISNAPPISAAGKKELNTLKVALRTIDKPSVSLKADLSALAKVVAGINKGASNETFALELRTAVSNYVGVLIATNDTLRALVADANNNPKVKAKALAALDAAGLALAGVDAEANLNLAAKSLGKVLAKYLAATKAVLAAVNAKVVPLPAPKAGTLVLEVNGQILTYGAQFPLRNATATGMVGSGAGSGSYSTLVVHVPVDGAPGTYIFGLIIQDVVNGLPFGFAAGGDATVTTANASVVAGTIEGFGTVTINGVSTINVPFKCRFSGKKLSFGI